MYKIFKTYILDQLTKIDQYINVNWEGKKIAMIYVFNGLRDNFSFKKIFELSN